MFTSLSLRPVLLVASIFLACSGANAQFQSPALGEGPWDIQTFQAKVNISVVARGIVHPWSVAFLPNGDMLVTEREGKLRLIHEGSLDPQPIDGVPAVKAQQLLGLMEVLLHPGFAQNGLLYLTYHKEIADKEIAFVLAQAKLEGKKLVGLKELLVTDTWDGAGGAAARLVFGNDGKLYMSVGATRDPSAQNPASLRGKILRLNDDGTAAQA